MIHMTHPIHGEMDCYLDSEVENNKENGWTVVERPVLQLHHPDEAPVISLEAQYEAKFGKKPHHRMKRETIENALKE